MHEFGWKAFCLAVALCVAGTAEAQTNANRLNVRSFGAVGDGRASDTGAVQRGIDAAAAAHGTLVFPAGTYRSGTLVLRSHMTLELQHGAVLQGNPDVNDYGSIAQFGLAKHYGVDSSGEGNRVGLLIAQHVEDIRITGDGVIDGNGTGFFDETAPHMGRDYDEQFTRNPAAFLADLRKTVDGPLEAKPTGRPGTMVIFDHADHITLEGVTFSNAPNWTLHFQHAHNLVVHAIRVANDMRLPNNDGLDCMDCHDLRVSDSALDAGDDDFAIVGSDGIAITNCVLRSYSAAIRFEDSHNAVFSNLVIRANRGIALFARAGAHTSNVLFTSIVIETRLKHGHWWGKGEPIYIANSATPENGSMRDVTFTDIIADADAGILLDSTVPDVVTGITLRNVSMTMHAPAPDLAASEGGNFDMRWTATAPDRHDAVFKHDIPAVYAHNIGTLTIDGLDVRWPAPATGQLPVYFSSAIDVSDFYELNLQRITATAAPNSTAAAIHVTRGDSVTVRDSTALPGTRRFLDATAIRNPIFASGNDLHAAARSGLDTRTKQPIHTH